jgi:tetratricopeptide (TPR) repeat protein
MTESPGDKTRLTSWKEVAAFLGTTSRTAMRWELERGLPIHRLPGESRSRIHADVAELRAWLNPTAHVESEPQSPPETAASGASDRRGRRLLLKAGPYLLAGVAAVVIISTVWLSVRSASPHTLGPAALPVYETAIANFDRRTSASLAAAVDDFTKVSQIDPDASEGFTGLAMTYDVMPEYTAMNAAQAYALAETNARRAIALNPSDARAHASFAFARSYGAFDFETARREFARAVKLAPDDSLARHWYATFLLSTGYVREALSEIDRAHALDPASRSIAADRGIILADNGRRQEAIAVLNKLAEENESFCSPHAYLAQIAFESADDEMFVRESRITADLKGDLYRRRLADAAAAGLKQGGHVGMLRALLAERRAQLDAGVGSPVDIAKLYLMLGDKAQATQFMMLAIKRKDTEVAFLALSPDLQRLIGGTARQGG